MKPIKLTVRYLIIAFIMYLAYRVTSPEYLADVQEINSTTMNIVVGAIFGALTLVINSHMAKKVDD